MRFVNRFKADTEQEINMSPLIDMVFILLIFFMVSASFVKDMDLEIDRPKASSATPSSTKAIRVYIDNQGSTYVDDREVSIWALQSRIRELFSSGSSSVLVITDESVSASKLIQVVDQCRLAGAENVGVVTQREAG